VRDPDHALAADGVRDRDDHVVVAEAAGPDEHPHRLVRPAVHVYVLDPAQPAAVDVLDAVADPAERCPLLCHGPPVGP
jgi:hypothetical protein